MMAGKVFVGAVFCAVLAGACRLYLYAERFSDGLAMTGNSEFAFHTLHPVRYAIMNGAVLVLAAVALIGFLVAYVLWRRRAS